MAEGGQSNPDRIHGNLLVQLDRNFTKADLKQFKLQVGGFQQLGTGELERCEDALDVLKLMERRGVIRVGEYGNLRQIFQELKLENLLSTVKDHEKQMGIGQGEDPCSPFMRLQELVRRYCEGELPVLPNSPWEDDDAELELEKVFTNLTWEITESEHVEVFPYEKLLEGTKRRFLILGEAGIGKTTFTHKLALDWARGKLPQFELVLPIPLRLVTKGQSLLDVVSNQLLSTNIDIQPTDVERLLNSKKVMVILDGYDEFDEKTSAEIAAIIHWKALQECYVVITSRLGSGSEIKDRNYQKAKIVGFSQENIIQYASKILSEDVDNFITYLENRQVYDTLARVPFTLHGLILIYKEDPSVMEHMNSGLSDIYLQLHTLLLKRYSQRKHEQVDKEDDVFGHYKNFLSRLGKHAFKKLFQTNGLLFEKGKYSGEIQKAEDVGLMYRQKITRKTKPVIQWSFQHKSLQEFVSAVYIVKSAVGGDETPLGSLMQHCQSRKEVEDNYLLLKFCAGLCHTGVVGAVLDKLVNLCNQWGYNLGDILLDVLQKVDATAGSPCLTACQASLNKLTELWLEEYSGRIPPALAACSLPALCELRLEEVSDSVVQDMCRRSELSSLQRLYLYHLRLDSTAMEGLTAGLSHNTRLTGLWLHDCTGLSAAGCEGVRHRLLWAACSSPALEWLWLEGSELNDDDLEVIQQTLIEQCEHTGTQLTELELMGNRFSEASRRQARTALRAAMPETSIII